MAIAIRVLVLLVLVPMTGHAPELDLRLECVQWRDWEHVDAAGDAKLVMRSCEHYAWSAPELEPRKPSSS